jgi:hypothetical protein
MLSATFDRLILTLPCQAADLLRFAHRDTLNGPGTG